MFKHRISVRIVALVVSVGIAACGQTATPPSSALPSPSDEAAGPSGSPTLPSGERGPSASPTAKPVATPTPRPRLAHWATRPTRIFAGECSTAVATVDGSGRFHVAADCGQRIRYAVSANGTTWKASTLPATKDRLDVGAQLAVDGSTLYLAFTRLRPIDPGCGDDEWTAVGVFYRTRTLPNGAWSRPTQIGPIGDQLSALRVVDGVIHETVLSDDGNGPAFYAVAKGKTFTQVLLPEAQGTSLRIGDDGRPRIAYSTTHAIRYAIVKDDGRLSVTTVFADDSVFTAGPLLVLGSGDRAFMSWAAMTDPSFFGGCTDVEPPDPPNKGTWFATDVDGKWATKRLSKDVGTALLALDVDSGRLHAVYADRFGVRYVTRAAGGKWTGSRLDVHVDIYPSSLRRDPATGRLLLVGPNADDSLDPGVYAVTAS